MKLKLFALIIFTVCISSLHAQDKKDKGMKSSTPVHLSFGLDAGAPLGNNANTSAFVAGGDLQVEYELSQNFSVTGSAGLEGRLNKGGVVNTKYFAPLLGGLRYYFSTNFYISEQAGYSLSLTKGTSAAFTNVAGLGFKLSKNSDVLFAYKGLFNTGGIANYNTIAARIAYVFGK